MYTIKLDVDDTVYEKVISFLKNIPLVNLEVKKSNNKELERSKEKILIQDKLDRVKQFAGKGKIYDRFNNLTSAQIREKIAKEKYGC